MHVKLTKKPVDYKFVLQVGLDTYYESQFTFRLSRVLTSTNNESDHGIFSEGARVVLFDRARYTVRLDFGEGWKGCSHYEDPLAEIQRRVKLVKEAFAALEKPPEVTLPPDIVQIWEADL